MFYFWVSALSDAWGRLETVWNRLCFTRRKRIFVYSCLQNLLSNGVMLGDALDKVRQVLSDGGKKDKKAEVLFLTDAIYYLGDGQKMSQALYNWVPYLEATLIDAGEETGKISESLLSTINVIERRMEVVASIRGALLYPAGMLLVSVLMIYATTQKLIPIITMILPPEKVNQGYLGVLIAVGDVVGEYGLTLCLLALAFTALLLISLSRWTGSTRFIGKWRSRIDKIPPYSLYRLFYGATFIHVIAVMMKNGISLSDAVLKMRDRANPWLRERLDGAAYGLGMGSNLGIALEKAGHDFPDKLAVSFIRVLAEYSGFEESLLNYGDRWMDDSIMLIKRSAKVLGNIGIVFVAVVLIFILTVVFELSLNLMDMNGYM